MPSDVRWDGRGKKGICASKNVVRQEFKIVVPCILPLILRILFRFCTHLFSSIFPSSLEEVGRLPKKTVPASFLPPLTPKDEQHAHSQRSPLEDEDEDAMGDRHCPSAQPSLSPGPSIGSR